MTEDPLGAVTRKQLNFFWIADCSGSMQDEKIEQLNRAVRESLPAARDANKKNPFAEVLVRVIRFSSGAQWHQATPTLIDDFEWNDLDAEGVTDLGAAIKLISEALDPNKLGKRALPPVLVLLSDGMPTDDWESALSKFNSTPWGKQGRTVRVAIAIGGDANRDALAKFTGNMETVLTANNPQQLATFIRWCSVALSSYVSSGKSTPKQGDAGVVDIVQKEKVVVAETVDDEEVW